MTIVVFKFSYPGGEPIVDAPFTVQLPKSSFYEYDDLGIAIPDTIEAVTDANGEARLELMPVSQHYWLQMEHPDQDMDDRCPRKLKYRFVVPQSDTEVSVEQLIVTDPTWSKPWDETALQIIIDAKVSSQASAEAAEASAVRAETAAQGVEASAEAAIAAAAAAKASEDAAKLSETAAKASEDAAAASQLSSKASEDAALVSQQAAALSETNAAASATAAASSEANAGISESAASSSAAAAMVSQNAAKASQDAALASEQSAEQDAATAVASAAAAQATAVAAAASQASATASESAAAQSAADALASKNAAATSETNAGTSAATAVQAATDAEASEQTATSAASTATGAATTSVVARDRAEQARDEAIAAAATVTGSLADGGAVDLSGGTYPPKPPKSTFWKVTVGGEVDGIDYGVGDTLVYTFPLDQFYKIDNTESVSSVAGKTGVVILDKTDVGLPLVDNTADADKPVSGPQAAALVAKADIQDNLVSTDAAKPLSANQGRVLAGMIQASSSATLRVFAYTVNVEGKTTFTGADDKGQSLIYVPGNIIVTLNGVSLVPGVDYTATDGTSAVLAQGAKLGSVLQVLVFGAISIADVYTKPEADALLAVKAATSDLGTAAFATLATGVFDGTAGRVLRVGDHGLGAVVATVLSTDLDSLNTTGLYYTHSSAAQGSLPVKKNGYLESRVFQPNQYALQVFTTYDGDSWERLLQAGVWGSWFRKWNAHNVVGNVSQAGGLPTGSIIERGSNGWGEFIRFADGTQICTFDRPGVVKTTNAWAANLYISTRASLNFPMPFVDLPRVSPALRFGGTGSAPWPLLQDVSETDCNMYAVAPSNTGTAYLGYNAIGRWF